MAPQPAGEPTDARQHQHRCLVRQLLAWRETRGLDWLRDYITGWPLWPGLKDDFADQWAKGNRGALGDWR